MDAIILAGGKGIRMESDLPKALVPARGKPIIDHQLDYLVDKVGRIVLSLGYRGKDVMDHVRKKYSSSRIRYSLESSPLGTGGGLKKALTKTPSQRLLVLNCDDLTDIPVNELDSRLLEDTVFIANPKLPFGLVHEANGYALFDEKPKLGDLWVSCGWYLFNRKSLNGILPEKGSLEYDVLQAKKLLLRTYKHTGFWQPLNSPKQIAEFEEGWKPAQESKDKQSEKGLTSKIGKAEGTCSD